MILAVIAILSVVFVFILLRKNRQSRLPEYLRGKKVDRYDDLITDRKIYIASHRDPRTRKYIHEAYYAEDGSTCKKALYRMLYGFVYYEEGELKMVPQDMGYAFLRAVREGKDPGFEFHNTANE